MLPRHKGSHILHRYSKLRGRLNFRRWRLKVFFAREQAIVPTQSEAGGRQTRWKPRGVVRVQRMAVDIRSTSVGQLDSDGLPGDVGRQVLSSTLNDTKLNSPRLSRLCRPRRVQRNAKPLS